MVKLPVRISLRHRGKVLGLDSETETMTLLDPRNEPLGAVSWEAVIDFMHGYLKEPKPIEQSGITPAVVSPRRCAT
jgi:hypothetical protein